MRIAGVSILSIMACFSAFASARLPVVNVSAASVSARSAFGEYGSENLPQGMEVSALPKNSNIKSAQNTDKNIIAKRDDVLSPKRPTLDLWANGSNDKSDSAQKVVTRAALVTPELNNAQVVARTGALDEQIAKLVDSKRESDSVQEKVIARAAQQRPSNISSYDVKQSTDKSEIVASTESNKIQEPVVSMKNADSEIKISRMVVPMESDVVVRQVKNNDTEKTDKFVSAEEENFAKLSPTELKKAFKKTYLSENKHLSTYQVDDRFDVASDVATNVEGFTSETDLSENGGVRPLEIKIGFRGDDSALSRDNYNLLNEYASIIVSNPKRAIQVSIPEKSTRSLDDRKLAARRLAIVEQVLRDTGVSEQRIMPVLSQRTDENFVLRVISSDQYETLTQQKKDMFGDSVGKKTYKSMTW